jgi:hypothetical protein
MRNDTSRWADRVTVTCDVEHVPCDAGAVDAMARLRVRAGRLGIDVRYHDPGDELRALVELIGLTEVLLGSGLDAGSEAEEREEPSGVEEERDA